MVLSRVEKIDQSIKNKGRSNGAEPVVQNARKKKDSPSIIFNGVVMFHTKIFSEYMDDP